MSAQLLTDPLGRHWRQPSEGNITVDDTHALMSARIAELEQSVTVRDTEIARLDTDLELVRRDAEYLRLFARIRFGYAPGDYFGTCHCCKSQFIGDKRAMNCEACADKAIDKARAGNGESGDAAK